MKEEFDLPEHTITASEYRRFQTFHYLNYCAISNMINIACHCITFYFILKIFTKFEVKLEIIMAALLSSTVLFSLSTFTVCIGIFGLSPEIVRYLNKPIRIKLNKTHLIAKQIDNCSTYAWDTVHKIVQNKNATYIYVSSLHAILIPYRIFETPKAYEEYKYHIDNFAEKHSKSKNTINVWKK